MKQLTFLLKSALLAGVFALAFAGCSKDDDDDFGLTGHWVFLGDANCIFTLDGVKHNAIEEGMLDRSYFSNLRGVFFIFEDGGTAYVGMNGKTSSPAKYTVSGNTVTIKDGSFSLPMKYRVSGEKLELTWTEATMALLGIDDSPLTGLGIYEYEAIMSFVKAD
ncbi:MAG: hypothetical protein LBM08_10120 [Dysgonamonadaceae bacterium]|jgi:hypothetical protein|nr:hypothetical protein [Dysgonamonadaceae bacterium]